MLKTKSRFEKFLGEKLKTFKGRLKTFMEKPKTLEEEIRFEKAFEKKLETPKKRVNLEKLLEAIAILGPDKLEFSRKINVSYQSVLNWVHGKTIPHINYARRIEEETKGKIKIKDLYNYQISKMKDK